MTGSVCVPIARGGGAVGEVVGRSVCVPITGGRCPVVGRSDPADSLYGDIIH